MKLLSDAKRAYDGALEDGLDKGKATSRACTGKRAMEYKRVTGESLRTALKSLVTTGVTE